jgi:antitoxin component of RelBE/YafQ-DinJ toxin-antitoxin module
MDTKLTLSLDEKVIDTAKSFAAQNGISLSRLVEYLFLKIAQTEKPFKTLEDIDVASFVSMLAEPEVEFNTSNKKSLKTTFRERKSKK